jgi:lysyl-tRNA synthetase class 2
MTDQPAVPVDAEDDLPEQIRVRREKRQRLLDAGQDAYPVAVPRTHSIAQVRAAHPDLPPDTATGEVVSIAGRVIFVRNTGKLCFATLRSGGGAEIQAMLSLDKVGEDRLAAWKSDVDLGDHVSVTGEVITSRRGELSILADSWVMAAKTLRPLPVEHKPLAEETRVRQRYVDLVVRPQAREVARLRVAVVASLRESFARRGFLEVETPMLQTLHGGASARPFVTHSNAFDMDLYLRIAPELFLKRCIVGGMERVFEINRNFRNEGVSTRHNPEFTMLEFYQAYADYRDLMDLTCELLKQVAIDVTGNTLVTFQGLELDFGQVRRYTMREAVCAFSKYPEKPTLDNVRDPEWLRRHSDKATAGEALVDIFERHCEEALVQPTIIHEYPVEVSPLAKQNPDDPTMTDRFEIYAAGMEIGNAFTELNDPDEQRRRFEMQLAMRERGDEEAHQMDEDYLRALCYGMPPTGGEGIGIDRVTMLMTDSKSIRDVILFPLLRPEGEIGIAGWLREASSK